MVPNVGYNKNLKPLPMKGDQHFYVNVSYNIKHILYIDEDENFIRITYNLQKDWYDSSLTFQNLKKDRVNSILEDDKKMLWSSWITFKNNENIDMSKRADDEEIFIQGVPYYWAHFVFVIFSGSRAHTEELFIAIG